MNFTTAHFEHAVPILAELDLDSLLGAEARLKAGDEGVLRELMTSLSVNAKSRTFRRLAAIVGASVEELLEAEANDAKMASMEVAAASLPFKEAVQRVFGFFSELAPSVGVIPAFSGNPTNPADQTPLTDAFPSVDS